MKLKDLIKKLNAVEDKDVQVFMSSDQEGNSYSPVEMFEVYDDIVLKPFGNSVRRIETGSVSPALIIWPSFAQFEVDIYQKAGKI